MSRAEWQRTHRLAMWQACEETGDQEVVLSVLKGGFPINTDLDGSGTPGDYTPLHAACKSGFAEIVDLLIDGGANVNALANLDRTPLHIAALTDQPNCAAKLLEANSNVFLCDKDGLTALQLAKKYHPDSAVVGLLAEAERLASVRPKSPMLGPRKEAQLALEKELAEKNKQEAAPQGLHGGSHMPWKPRDRSELSVHNVGARGTHCNIKGSAIADPASHNTYYERVAIKNYKGDVIGHQGKFKVTDEHAHWHHAYVQYHTPGADYVHPRFKVPKPPTDTPEQHAIAELEEKIAELEKCQMRSHKPARAEQIAQLQRQHDALTKEGVWGDGSDQPAHVLENLTHDHDEEWLHWHWVDDARAPVAAAAISKDIGDDVTEHTTRGEASILGPKATTPKREDWEDWSEDYLHFTEEEKKHANNNKEHLQQIAHLKACQVRTFKPDREKEIARLQNEYDVSVRRQNRSR